MAQARMETPTVWWKLNASKYPNLKKLAQKYFTVCATSAASEHIFSTSRWIVTPAQARLNPDKDNMLTFLSKNSK